MKMSVLSVLAVLAVAGCCLFETNKSGGSDCVNFPGTAVPQPKLDQIISRLRQDTKFPENYRVRQWKGGKRVLTIGKMKIDSADLSSMDAKAKSSGLTAFTYRVGICGPVVAFGCSTDCVPTIVDGKDLARDISKILKSL